MKCATGNSSLSLGADYYTTGWWRVLWVFGQETEELRGIGSMGRVRSRARNRAARDVGVNDIDCWGGLKGEGRVAPGQVNEIALQLNVQWDGDTGRWCQRKYCPVAGNAAKTG